MNRKGPIWTTTLRVAFMLILDLSVGPAGLVCAQQNQIDGQQGRNGIQKDQNVGNGKLEVLHVQGNVYMVSGAGANITVQLGDQTVVVVDSGVPQKSEEVLAAIQSITDKHILFIINTSADEDHTGGNEALSKAGWALPDATPDPTQRRLSNGSLPLGASILAHIHVLDRMSELIGKESLVPPGRWPKDTYDTDDWKLYNGEGVIIYHAPNAHTDGDSFVFFRKSDVVSTGDIVNLESYPVIKADQGGSINGLIDGLNQIIGLLEPEQGEEGGTYVIPGHGHIGDRNDVVNYRDMVVIIRGRIQNLLNKGMTLEQVKSAKTTLDYDGLYGTTTGPWTTDMFVEAIYRDLSKSKTTQKAVGGR
jgi:glyoxylase-like metal-dependent hydrolase (beta-lactamase superfamily II)